MERTPEDLERMREALASEQSAEKPLLISEQFVLLLGPNAGSKESATTALEPRKRTATERRTGLHIVDGTAEFMRDPVIISPAKKPTHQD